MTNKIICPDCEMQVDKLVSSTGTCMLCYKRMQNRKYRNEPYIPLVQLKGTTEYNRVMGRRMGAKARTEARKETKSTSIERKVQSPVIQSKISKVEGYDYIDINSTKILEVIDYLKYCLDNVPEMEKQVTAMQEEMLLITHQKEQTEGPGDPEYEKLSIREYSILKYRRQIKDALVYLRRIDPKILTDDLEKELEETKEVYEADKYIPKYQSRSKQFRVSVNVGGLHGSSKIELFRRHVFANDEIAARAYVEKYLKTLNNLTIYGKTWKIEEIKGEDNHGTNGTGI